jgi:hypothetical protein
MGYEDPDTNSSGLIAFIDRFKQKFNRYGRLNIRKLVADGFMRVKRNRYTEQIVCVKTRRAENDKAVVINNG